MPIRHLPADELLATLDGLDDLGGTGDRTEVLVVDLDAAAAAVPSGGLPAALPTGLARVVVGTTEQPSDTPHPANGLCDVILPAGDPLVARVADGVAARPVASAALALLLRGAADRSIDDGLLAEAAVYSSLQAGPEFASWRASRDRRERPDGGAPLSVARTGTVLDITLTRPRVRNALDAAMRDALVEAFTLVALDPTIAEVHLRGEGEAFCAGGDLDEFGTFPDPASALLIRLERSAGRGLAAVAGRVTAHLHGACIGSGIEVPAFAGTVLAHPSTVIGLPELSLGLIPGAGGTVSLPRRIGRHRTALLALSGERIDARTAFAWGLVDAVVEGDGPGAR